jgi:hypothetical protein
MVGARREGRDWGERAKTMGNKKRLCEQYYYPWMGSVAKPELSNTCVGLASLTYIFPLPPLCCFKLDSYMQIHVMHVLYYFDASWTRQWLRNSSAVPWSSFGNSVTHVCLVFLLRKPLSNLSCALFSDVSATICVFYIP